MSLWLVRGSRFGEQEALALDSESGPWLWKIESLHDHDMGDPRESRQAGML